MRVNLGRGDMAMAKELLDRADIVAVFKKLRRETVSQRVGGSVLREGLVQHASELAWRHGLRGYLQLASAAAWQQAIGRNVSLCTFDLKVWEAARIIGLFVFRNGVNARKLTHKGQSIYPVALIFADSET